jgi:hypothetical protein
MKPSVIVVLLKSSESYLMNDDVANLSKVNLLYQAMVYNVVKFRTLVFPSFKNQEFAKLIK